MRRLIFISIALLIPVIIWWIETQISKRKGEKVKGPSALVLFGIVVGIMFLIISLLITQTPNAPEGSSYQPASLVNGEIVPGQFSP